MFILDKYDVKVRVALDNGLYLFDNEASTGKTRLCSLLRQYQGYGEPVMGYTYDDYEKGIDISEALHEGYKLVVIDRYDMYRNHALDLIEDFARNSIVLVDCKYGFAGSDFDWCYINMTANSIEAS